MAILFVFWPGFDLILCYLGDPLLCLDLVKILFGVDSYIVEWDKYVALNQQDFF